MLEEESHTVVHTVCEVVPSGLNCLRAQTGTIHMACRKLIGCRGGSRIRWIWLMELDVTAGEEAGGDDDGLTIPVFFKLESEAVRPVGSGARFPAVVRSHSKVHCAVQICVRSAA